MGLNDPLTNHEKRNNTRNPVILVVNCSKCKATAGSCCKTFQDRAKLPDAAFVHTPRILRYRRWVEAYEATREEAPLYE
jgi:hypothetical protein